jgi:hypothetical protein
MQDAKPHIKSAPAPFLDRVNDPNGRAVDDAGVQCGFLVAKLIERRCVMLGLSTPQQAVLKIVNDASPNETTTDRTQRVLEEFAAQDRTKDDDPLTHHQFR